MLLAPGLIINTMLGWHAAKDRQSISLAPKWLRSAIGISGVVAIVVVAESVYPPSLRPLVLVLTGMICLDPIGRLVDKRYS